MVKAASAIRWLFVGGRTERRSTAFQSHPVAAFARELDLLTLRGATRNAAAMRSARWIKSATLIAKSWLSDS